MFFKTWRYAEFVLQFQMLSTLLPKVVFSLVCQGGCKGNRLEYWLFDAELQPRNVETACMQNSVFKAEVKAKVIALPAQERIKSEILTLTSFALRNSSWRMNLLVIFYVGLVSWCVGFDFVLFFIYLPPALRVCVCRTHSICRGPDWVITAIEQQKK